MESTTRLTPDDRPTKRAKTEEPDESMAIPESNSIKKEEPTLDDLDDEDPYAGYDEKQENTRAADLYLDTVNRAALDFDFEKVCSVSMSNQNIYGCLVCGKYFQGRGKSSHAYAHSIHEDHHVFIHLETTEVYVLPDGYQVSDPSLDDIKYVLSPRFSPAQIAKLRTRQHTDILRPDVKAVYSRISLLHVPPVRDFLLAMDGSTVPTPKTKPSAAPIKPIKQPSELVRRFAGLAKKVWNPRLFKSQGEVRLETQQVIVKADAASGVKPHFDIDREIKQTTTPFLLLALDLPPPPLFQDAVEKNIIPQVSLASLLAKYDGKTTQEFAGQLKRFRCTKLPPYIILHFKRFTKNNFVEERNPTIVNFPIDGVDFSQVLERSPELANAPIIYDLVANVTQESAAGTTHDKESTVWKIHLRAGRGEREQWFQIQDMIVEETRKEMIFLGETVVQIWELSRRVPVKGKA
ncbi:Spindle pole body protein [Rhizoctonia solani]|uniref:Spindle pole body protein n=1 Tax=Rhizoctonia solani TaxID=456999 RepID=A0A8H7IC02_9AGAM|nr:Spindle pole body protein [Rhizoctonia solani]